MNDDIVVMTEIGSNHSRPNKRRLIARTDPDGDESAVLIEQMTDGSGGWNDVGPVADLAVDDGSISIERREQSTVRDEVIDA